MQGTQGREGLRWGNITGTGDAGGFPEEGDAVLGLALVRTFVELHGGRA